ncbi:NINE protein [Actinomyces culturomici]|uniref:NINE protein n=1 Tax=Actinomyces culturomici TaxID=1926276 RepID=UPI000E20B8B7|nr:TM2 domain-containing protein [Actinomyces culturomici]
MNPNPSAPAAAPKSKAVAAVLGFFLGGFGAPDFYLGYTKIGVIKLVVWAIGAVLYVPGYLSAVASIQNGVMPSPSPAMAIGGLLMAALGIWAIVTFIQILMRKGRYATDANGQPLA